VIANKQDSNTQIFGYIIGRIYWMFTLVVTSTAL